MTVVVERHKVVLLVSDPDVMIAWLGDFYVIVFATYFVVVMTCFRQFFCLRLHVGHT